MRNQFDIRTEKLMAQEEARAEGKAEGRTEGRTEGRAEGRAEVARSMKADGVPVETIVKYSGLTETEVKAL